MIQKRQSHAPAVNGPLPARRAATGLALALAIACTAGYARTDDLTSPSPASRLPAHNKMEDMNLATGTAWSVAPGYAVTAWHIIAETGDIALVADTGIEYEANVVLIDEELDIALLAIENDGSRLASLPMAEIGSRLGASVFTVGFPRVDVMGRSPKVSQGIISGTNGLNDDPSHYQTSLPIQPGNSGGPLLNLKGEVVGVISSMLAVRNPGLDEPILLPNLNIAVKITEVQRLLESLPDELRPVDPVTSPEQSLEALAENVRQSVLIVVAR
ncbi:MAG: trypsin-like peptidase domain-containing protein [Gemmatimonadetes bacterium]|nr:trypsin-like peptidase domain-containing protein [Gemmatimonadota bacterium]